VYVASISALIPPLSMNFTCFACWVWFAIICFICFTACVKSSSFIGYSVVCIGVLFSRNKSMLLFASCTLGLSGCAVRSIIWSFSVSGSFVSHLSMNFSSNPSVKKSVCMFYTFWEEIYCLWESLCLISFTVSFGFLV